jgi:serine/threonine protein kinase
MNEYQVSIRSISLNEFFEHYQILGLIALGSSSEILRVKTPQGQLQTVKHLLPPLRDETWAQQALYREGVLLQVLDHDLFVGCNTILVDTQTFAPHNVHLLMLEHVSTISLRTLIRNLHRHQQYLQPIEIAYLMEHVYQAITYLHHVNTGPVIYNDLSPSNILVGREGKLHFIDLSSAFFPGCPARSPSYKGKKPYQSPEINSEYPGSIASDYFAWGQIIFELIIGKTFTFPLISNHDSTSLTIAGVIETPLLTSINKQKTPYNIDEYIQRAIDQRWPQRWAQMIFTALHPDAQVRLNALSMITSEDIWQPLMNGTSSIQSNASITQLRQKARESLQYKVKVALDFYEFNQI